MDSRLRGSGEKNPRGPRKTVHQRMCEEAEQFQQSVKAKGDDRTKRATARDVMRAEEETKGAGKRLASRRGKETSEASDKAEPPEKKPRLHEEHEERILENARSLLRDIDHNLKKSSGYAKLEVEGLLPVKQDQQGRKEPTFLHYELALEQACIDYHRSPCEKTTVKELLESIEKRFRTICPTDLEGQGSSSSISPLQTHIEKLKAVNENLTKKVAACQSALRQMQIPETEIARAQEIMKEAEKHSGTMPRDLLKCLENMKRSVQAAEKYRHEKDFVGIVSDPERHNDVDELCQALKIGKYRQNLEKALEMVRTFETDKGSKDDYENSKAVEVTQKKLEELGVLSEKAMKLCNTYGREIEDDSPEQYRDIYDRLNTIYEKTEDLPAWWEKCDDPVKASQELEEEKKQLNEILEKLQKYKVVSRLKDLRMTCEKVLQCFAKKDSSHTSDQILEHLEDFSQTSLLGNVIRKEFGEQFQAFCQYLRTLSQYEKKDPDTGEYVLQDIHDKHLIIHQRLALDDTLEQFEGTKGLVEQVKNTLGRDEPTEAELDLFLRDQPQKYTYDQVGLYKHWIDDNKDKEVKPRHVKTQISDTRLLSREEEDRLLTKDGLKEKVEILAYAQDIGHIYGNCHSLVVSDGKAGWIGKWRKFKEILDAMGFKKIRDGNLVTDQAPLPEFEFKEGDIIAFPRRGRADANHSSYVSEIKDGKTFITNKWGASGIYKHEIAHVDPRYGPYYEVYRTDRPTDNPLNARLLTRAEMPSILAWVRKPVPAIV